MKSKPNLNRLESTVCKKLDKGWNAFTREEVEALVILLKASRRTTRSLQHRLHMSHGDAVAWHFEDSVGLHANRPAPVGARNLFEKPDRIDFEPGWRIPKGVKIPGYSVNQDGELIHHTRRKPVSPNDAIRLLHQSLQALDLAYRRKDDLEANDGKDDTDLTGQAAGGDDHEGTGSAGVATDKLPEQPGSDWADLPGDGEEREPGADHPPVGLGV